MADSKRDERQPLDPDADQAFKKELTALIPYLRAFARSLANDPAAADDLAQEALLKAWDARASFEPGTNLKAWAFMILRNCFYSEKRRSWRQAAWDQEKAERTLTAASDPAAAIELDELRRALAELPTEQRDALVLIGAGGFSYEEAAQICGCAVGTIKSRVNRARKALEAIIESGSFAAAGADGVGASDAMESIVDHAKRIASDFAA
jgi:RNA polymerase sigma-70 factor (ECF subfamily)